MAPEYIRSLGGKERNKKFEKKSTNEAGKKKQRKRKRKRKRKLSLDGGKPPDGPTSSPVSFSSSSSGTEFNRIIHARVVDAKKKQKKTNVETKGPVHRERFFLLFFCLNVCVFISRRRIFWP